MVSITADDRDAIQYNDFRGKKLRWPNTGVKSNFLLNKPPAESCDSAWTGHLVGENSSNPRFCGNMFLIGIGLLICQYFFGASENRFELLDQLTIWPSQIG